MEGWRQSCTKVSKNGQSAGHKWKRFNWKQNISLESIFIEVDRRFFLHSIQNDRPIDRWRLWECKEVLRPKQDKVHSTDSAVDSVWRQLLLNSYHWFATSLNVGEMNS